MRYKHKKTGHIYTKDPYPTNNYYWDKAKEVQIPACYIENSNDWTPETTYITEDNKPIFLGDRLHWVINNNIAKGSPTWKYHYELSFMKMHFELIERKNIYKLFSTVEAALKFVEDNKFKPFLKTEDGIDKNIGDKVFIVRHTSPNLLYILNENGSTIEPNWIRPTKDLKDFDSLHNAEMYIFKNTKIELSLKDLENIGMTKDVYRDVIFLQKIGEKVSEKLGKSK
jgi:hypothetical protein